MYKTKQEQFWSGQFGDAYIERNNNLKMVASNVSLFSTILKSMFKIESCIEL